MSDLTFKEAIKIVREADRICLGRYCGECPLDREGDKCLGCVVPSTAHLKAEEGYLIDLKNAIHAFKEGAK